jgi:hypothetical protein
MPLPGSSPLLQNSAATGACLAVATLLQPTTTALHVGGYGPACHLSASEQHEEQAARIQPGGDRCGTSRRTSTGACTTCGCKHPSANAMCAAAQAPACPVLGSAQQQQAQQQPVATPSHSDHTPQEGSQPSGADTPQAPLSPHLLEFCAANPPSSRSRSCRPPPSQHCPRLTIRGSNAGELTATARSPAALFAGLPAAPSAPCVWQLQACSHTLFGGQYPGLAPVLQPQALLLVEPCCWMYMSRLSS